LIGTRIGRYVVDEWIGQGGMASVWRMTDDQGHLWALKVLTLDRAEVKTRFLAEARVQLGLSHPNIVTARELVEVNGEPALVLEYVPGLSLDRYLTERSPPFEVRDALAGQLLEGVAYAHSRNLVHRDLKPANVLVVEGPDGPVARLTDFGLVKELGLGATRTGIALGTPRYMAPEQIRDAKRVDPRADLWSLGTLLYEVYTDRSPFQRDALYDTFQAVIDGVYQDPGELGVPDRVRTAIVACLHLDPGARVQTVRDLQRLLRGAAQWSDVAPGSRPPPPASTPFGPPLRRPSAAPPPVPSALPTMLVSSPELDDELPPPPPPVLRTPPPAPRRAAAARWLWPWVAGWGLALLLVLGVLGGGTLVVAAVVLTDVFTEDPAPEPPARPPRPSRRRR
jgi:serine/threonine protein kinase